MFNLLAFLSTVKAVGNEIDPIERQLHAHGDARSQGTSRDNIALISRNITASALDWLISTFPTQQISYLNKFISGIFYALIR